MHRQFPARSPVSSRELNSFVDDMQTAVSQLQDTVQETNGELSRRRIDDAIGRSAGSGGNYRARRERLATLAAGAAGSVANGTEQTRVFTFFDTDGVFWQVDTGAGLLGYQVGHRCPVDTVFGQVTLPFNGVKSLFWSPGTEDRQESLYLPSVGVSWSEQSSMAADEVQASDPRNAFDGSTLDPFLLRASYPLEADIEEVAFDVDILVPQDIVRQANCLTIEAAPELHCSIFGIKYSDSAPVATTDIPGLPVLGTNTPLLDAGPLRFFFETLTVTSLKVSLSTRHYVIENGRKVFYLGLRELGLFLVDFDQSWANTPGSFTNNGLLIKLEVPSLAGVSPSTLYFNDITALKTSLEASTAAPGAGGTATGCRFVVYEDDTLGTIAFDSTVDAFPYTPSGNRDHLWVAVELDRQNESGLVPVLEAVTVSYNLKS